MSKVASIWVSVPQNRSWWWQGGAEWNLFLTNGIQRRCGWINSMDIKWWIPAVNFWTGETKEYLKMCHGNSDKVASLRLWGKISWKISPLQDHVNNFEISQVWRVKMVQLQLKYGIYTLFLVILLLQKWPYSFGHVLYLQKSDSG